LRLLGASESWIASTSPEELLRSAGLTGDRWASIQRRQRLLRDAALSHTGHRRPGMAAGKPWEQAESEARILAQPLDR
jgi:hypothetical protein